MKLAGAEMLPIPKKFFVTSGKAISGVSDLNAFDQSLLKAKIGEQNIVAVSSVLPEGIKQIDRKTLPMGNVTFCILAQQRGNEGEMISAGIAYAFRTDEHGGYVAEGHMHGTQKNLREFLRWKLTEMAKLRGVELKKIYYRTEELSIPMDKYGACVIGLVLL